jgi:hypothetical protein
MGASDFYMPSCIRRLSLRHCKTSKFKLRHCRDLTGFHVIRWIAASRVGWRSAGNGVHQQACHVTIVRAFGRLGRSQTTLPGAEKPLPRPVQRARQASTVNFVSVTIAPNWRLTPISYRRRSRCTFDCGRTRRTHRSEAPSPRRFDPPPQPGAPSPPSTPRNGRPPLLQAAPL